MKTKQLLLIICTVILASCNLGKAGLCDINQSNSDLVFTDLANTWDEGIPLGNATVGALVWQKDSALRMSLDRTDLWDLRPSDSLSGDEFKFSWVKEHIKSKNYKPVQKKLDAPYDVLPAPSKIPGAAIEFPLSDLGRPSQVKLYLNNALCEVKWPGGTVMQTFVQADKPVGWFIFKNLKKDMVPSLLPPLYQKNKEHGEEGPVEGQNLERLGYEQGSLEQGKNRITYHQKGCGDFYYDVVVEWKKRGTGTLVGTWSVTSSMEKETAIQETATAMNSGIVKGYKAHTAYWNHYWNQSEINLPDTLLQKQYDNEMYKFGSASRENSSPISLQAVWTADNGRLPPWKGDYHHDLNTQLSYWPAYIGNHLDEEMGYLNTLWNQRDIYKKYTRQYFETDGMNIPGVCTLTGEPMGGWIQYSMSQTIAAWLAQHFYLHWVYSADDAFLKNRAYPFVKDVAVYLEQQSKVDSTGNRTLEYSSSPEIYDNSLKAWFPTISNYDLSLMKFLFGAASEMADSLNLKKEAEHWNKVKNQLPDFDLADDGSLTFAKGFPYNTSHRHFSNAMAIFPLGLIDWNDGEKSQHIINATLKRLKDYGPDYWVGYSYSWYANMFARAHKGDEAAENLRTFAKCFCLKNTFHANGDQTKTGKSKFTYRPFTLEGNFAFASGVQEMLLQSQTGVISLFPAIPGNWKDVSFNNLLARGGVLVSATMHNKKITYIRLTANKACKVKLLSPVSGKVEEISVGPKNSFIYDATK